MHTVGKRVRGESTWFPLFSVVNAEDIREIDDDMFTYRIGQHSTTEHMNRNMKIVHHSSTF